MPSHRECRKWLKIGSTGRQKRIRQSDQGHPRYWRPRREKRWVWGI